MDLMSYLFVNFVTFLVSTEKKCHLFVNFVTFLVFIKRKCHICDIIVLNKLTLTQSRCISVT